jgi:hypothetical protein
LLLLWLCTIRPRTNEGFAKTNHFIIFFAQKNSRKILREENINNRVSNFILRDTERWQKAEKRVQAVHIKFYFANYVWTNAFMNVCTGLPNGTLSYQKCQFGLTFDCQETQNVLACYGHLESFTIIWNTYLMTNKEYFMAIWYNL